MKDQMIISFPGNELLSESLASALDIPIGRYEMRRFPDGETYIRMEDDVEGKSVAVVCTLDRPDEKIVQLLMLLHTLTDLGANKVGLIAPYLCYMRQDIRFLPGEGITSAYFAGWVSGAADWLITVDPHLHRLGGLGEIYSIPSTVLTAGVEIAAWIYENVKEPLLIGPDAESEQWVSSIAEMVGAPYVVLQKKRLGDRKVDISIPDLQKHAGRTAVLVDDIMSTARTMMKAVELIGKAGFKEPVCIGVHPIFGGEAYEDLKRSGAGRIVSCNTIPHASNGIDISQLIIGELSSGRTDLL